MEPDGKVVVITGSAGGIGGEIARQMAARGSRIVVTDINADGAAEQADAIVAAGGEAIAIACDVSRQDQVEQLVAGAIGRYDRIDILINNAVNHPCAAGNIDGIDLAAFNGSWDVNVVGSLRVIDAVLPHMRVQREGYIINTASSLAIRPNAVIKHLMPYVTSKGAVLSLSQALAFALEDSNVRVSCWCPGLTNTRPGQEMRVNANGWMDGVREDLTIPRPMAEAVALLLEGIAREDFLISSEEDWRGAIQRLAAHELDPRRDYQ